MQMERNIDQEREKGPIAFYVFSGQTEIKRLNSVMFPKARRQYKRIPQTHNSITLTEQRVQ